MGTYRRWEGHFLLLAVICLNVAFKEGRHELRGVVVLMAKG